MTLSVELVGAQVHSVRDVPRLAALDGVRVDQGPLAYYVGANGELYEAQRELLALYRDNGFPNAKVREPERVLSRDRKVLTLRFQVTEGQRYRLGRILIEVGQTPIVDGAQPPRAMEPPASVPELVPGAWYSNERLSAAMARLKDLYREAGYAFASVGYHTDSSDKAADALDLFLVVFAGRVVSIAGIEVEGLAATAPAELKVGDTWQQSKIEAARAALGRAHPDYEFYYDPIEVADRPDQAVLRFSAERKSGPPPQ